MGQLNLAELLSRHDDLDRLITPRVRAGLHAMDLEEPPSQVQLAGACLGHAYEAVGRLVEHDVLPGALTDRQQQQLADELGVAQLSEAVLRAHRGEVVAALGLPAGVTVQETPIPPTVEPTYPLFTHQRRALHELHGLLDDRASRALLHMPTGAGKTRTAMNLICDHLRTDQGQVVLWVASTTELCEQAALEFVRAWGCLGDREVAITAGWGGRTWEPEHLRDGLLVATPQTLHSRSERAGPRFLSDLGMQLSLIVFDEAHQAIAPTYRGSVEHLSASRSGLGITPILGLTATPGRTFSGTEDADAALAEFFHYNKVELDISVDGESVNPVDYLIREGYLAQARFEVLSPNGAEPSDAPTEITYETDDHVQLRMDPVDYLALTAGAVRDLIERGRRRILVFAASVQLAADLAAMLRCCGVRAENVDGSTPSDLRAAAIARYQSGARYPRVLVNFGVLTAGFDAPHTDAAVIARPTCSLVLYSQMVGRAIRGPKAGGTEDAVVITVIDPEIPAFGNIASAFTNWEELWHE